MQRCDAPPPMSRSERTLVVDQIEIRLGTVRVLWLGIENSPEVLPCSCSLFRFVGLAVIIGELDALRFTQPSKQVARAERGENFVRVQVGEKARSVALTVVHAKRMRRELDAI